MHNRTCWRGLAFLIAPTFLACLAWLSTGLEAQEGGKPGPKEEVEDTVKPVKKKIIVPDDEPTTNMPAKGTGTESSDLSAAYAEALHPDVKELYKRLKVPHDRITFSNHEVTVEPIPQFLGNPPRFTGYLKLQPFDSEWKPATPLPATQTQVKSVQYYEEYAQEMVTEFLEAGYERKSPSSGRYLSKFETLETGEKALAFVVRFHESARQRGQRRGEGWSDVEAKLRKKLLDVQAQQLDALAEADDWDHAYRLAVRLKEVYPKLETQEVFAKALLRLIEKSAMADNFTQVQLRSRLLDDLFPRRQTVGSFNVRLQKEAQAKLDEAKTLGEPRGLTEQDRARAQTLVQLARLKWPLLPGLEDYELQLRNAYPILRIGMSALPHKDHLSPATALTNADRWAVELIFESLIKPSSSASAGQRHEPGLAMGQPRLIPLGRQFQLPRNAFWSNGQQVTAADVSNTVRLLKDDKWPGRTPAWDDLIEAVNAGSDSFRVNLTMRQGYIDPLSLMTFKILPQVKESGEPALGRADDATFASHPVGSGPYQWKGPIAVTGRDQKPREAVAFVANPHYSGRTGNLGLPRIREIHFLVSTNPGKDLDDGTIDLFLDLPAKDIQSVRSAAKRVRISKPLPNRRVYFLAVNHVKPALKNEALRRALAFAINRETILDDYLRPGNKEKPHRVLNGPFPAGSWACAEAREVPVDLFQPGKAKSEAATLPEKLTLKYPDGDRFLAEAMTALSKQVKTILGVEIELIKMDPYTLRKDVEMDHDFELAYYHYDHPSDAYWIWPLFDPRGIGIGGSNYLSYDDPTLAGLFDTAMKRRSPEEWRKYMQFIHRHLYTKMPLIPLWQLDTFVAYTPDLKFDPDQRFDPDKNPLPIDPLLVFTEADHWKLERQTTVGSNR